MKDFRRVPLDLDHQGRGFIESRDTLYNGVYRRKSTGTLPPDSPRHTCGCESARKVGEKPGRGRLVASSRIRERDRPRFEKDSSLLQRRRSLGGRRVSRTRSGSAIVIRLPVNVFTAKISGANDAMWWQYGEQYARLPLQLGSFFFSLFLERNESVFLWEETGKYRRHEARHGPRSLAEYAQWYEMIPRKRVCRLWARKRNRKRECREREGALTSIYLARRIARDKKPPLIAVFASICCSPIFIPFKLH